jgi:hypothetical protein
VESSTCIAHGDAPYSSRIFPNSRGKNFNSGETIMSGQVILYFDDQADALRFALAAGSVMAGEGTTATDDLVHETTRVCRIRLDAVNASAAKKPAA